MNSCDHHCYPGSAGVVVEGALGSRLCQSVAEDKAMRAARSSLDVSGRLERRELKRGADFPRGKSTLQ